MDNSSKLVVLVFIKLICYGILASASVDCPVDFYVKNGACTDCPDGTFGPNCTHTCSYPTYGRRCILECKCTGNQKCDPAEGCINKINDQSSTYLSGNFTADTWKTKPVTESITEIAQKITLQQQSVRPSTSNVVPQTSSDVSSTILTFKTEHLNTAREFIQVKTGSPASQNNTVIIVIVIVGSIVILLLVVVIAVQIRGKQKRRVHMRETVSFTRGHSSTYCEIDDQMVPSTSDYHLINDDYEHLKQSEADRTKYSTLPTKMNEAEKGGYLSPKSKTLQKVWCAEKLPLNNEKHGPTRHSIQDINLHYTALPTKRKATSELISHKTPLANSAFKSDYETESSEGHVKPQQIDEECPVHLRKAEENLDTNVLRVPKSVKISTDSYIDMDKGTKLDEYVAMEEHGKKITKHCESEEKLEITDTYK